MVARLTPIVKRYLFKAFEGAKHITDKIRIPAFTLCVSNIISNRPSRIQSTFLFGLNFARIVHVKQAVDRRKERHPYTKDRVIESFWKKVQKSDWCWLWTGAKKDYGLFPTGGRLCGRQQAHSFSFWLHNGALDLQKVTHHKCHVKICVNPDHLEQVTHAENCAAERGIPRTPAFDSPVTDQKEKSEPNAISFRVCSRDAKTSVWDEDDPIWQRPYHKMGMGLSPFQRGRMSVAYTRLEIDHTWPKPHPGIPIWWTSVDQEPISPSELYDMRNGLGKYWRYDAPFNRANAIASELSEMNLDEIADLQFHEGKRYETDHL